MADQKLDELTQIPNATVATDLIYVVRDGVDYKADIANVVVTPTAHATSHQNGGADEISVAGLSGELADPQPPKDHDHSSNKLAQANTHESADTDSAPTSLHHTLGTSANQACAGNDLRLSDTRDPKAHASTHTSGQSDAIKLDDLAAPDDNTDLDASTSKHGLMAKADKTKLDKLSVAETLAWDFQMSDGSDLTTGAGTPLTVPTGTITGWRILVIDGTGSLTFDLRKSTYAAFPPSTSIVASAPPSISSTTKGESTTLTGWTTALTAGDVIVPHITAGGTGIKKARLELTVERT